MTRLALVPSAYLPDLGGVEELTRHLALQLRAEGDEVEIWTGRDPRRGLPALQTLDGLTVRRFAFELPAASTGALARFPGAASQALRAMRGAAAALRPELLHVQCFGPNGVYAAALSALARVPLVVTLQGETMMDNDDIYDRSVVLRTGLRVGLRRAAAVTACSRFTLDDAERRFGLARGRGSVVFNGVGGDGTAPASDAGERSVASWGRYVFAVGRVVEKKGFDLLLRAFAEVAPRHDGVSLVLGGTGVQLAALEALAASLGVAERVRFTGRLAREEVAAAMAGAEVFVMPSRLEPFGIVVLEGWRAGAPVVATSRGGPPEFVHDGEDGLLVDPFDLRALAAALDRLLDDEALRRRIGAAGRERVGEFSWPEIARQYHSVYDRVLQSSRR